MLLQLNISNFALIENLSISFENGFNILSGETGAGKSILIDAINYVLGVKFTKNSIRTGEKKTFVEAVFTLENIKTKNILEKLEIEFDDILIISREAFKSGKNIAKINGKTVILNQIKEVSETLMDIHGQHENQNLMNPEKHITYVDNYGYDQLKEIKNQYKIHFNELKETKSKINELKDKTGTDDKILDFLKYQIAEINEAKLNIGEDEILEEKYSIVSNSESIKKILSDSYERLYNGSENVDSIFDGIGIIIKELGVIESNSKDLKNIRDSLKEIYYSLEQNISEIRTIKENVEFDDKELEYINNRLYIIDNLKKKYGDTIEKIITYKEKVMNEYNELIHCSEIIEELEAKRDNFYKKVISHAKELHIIREKIGKSLENKVLNELKYIGLEKSIFKVNITFSEEYLNENGADRVQFYITTNPGEPLNPLEKVVSGGELSRIMLALKTVFVDKDKIPSVIFDEIDTGISGRVAQSVAEKLYNISNKHQVFCVTHLAQIACMSDIHYLVEKKVLNDKTYTYVNRLSLEEKERSIARMIGGTELTKLTLENAKEMINLANKKKQLIRKI